jgi:hypothetical protein
MLTEWKSSRHFGRLWLPGGEEFDMQTITVKPIGDRNWIVEYSGAQNPQIFATGGLAEREAKRLAEALAKAGNYARISVYLRDGSLAGSFVAIPSL